MKARWTRAFAGAPRGSSRAYPAIGLRGVSDLALLEFAAAEYAAPDTEAFAAEMLRAADELSSAGALDSGNGEVLDARIDRELERACAHLSRQHAINAVMLDRIEASLRARLETREARAADVAERLDAARAEAARIRDGAMDGGAGLQRGPDGAEARRGASRAVIRFAPRLEGGAVRDTKEAGHA